MYWEAKTTCLLSFIQVAWSLKVSAWLPLDQNDQSFKSSIRNKGISCGFYMGPRVDSAYTGTTCFSEAFLKQLPWLAKLSHLAKLWWSASYLVTREILWVYVLFCFCFAFVSQNCVILGKHTNVLGTSFSSIDLEILTREIWIILKTVNHNYLWYYSVDSGLTCNIKTFPGQEQRFRINLINLKHVVYYPASLAKKTTSQLLEKIVLRRIRTMLFVLFRFCVVCLFVYKFL